MNTSENNDAAPILVSVALDEHARECLRHACHRALHSGQPVVAVHIVHEKTKTTGVYRRSRYGASVMPLDEIAQRMLADFVADWRREHPEVDDVVLECYAVPGIPETRIPELAERFGADLIVLGGSVRRGLQRLLGRCLACTVLRRVRCQVTVIDRDGRPIDPEHLLPKGSGSGTGPASAAQAG